MTKSKRGGKLSQGAEFLKLKALDNEKQNEEEKKCKTGFLIERRKNVRY